jgi:hypothetical protein
VEEWLMGVDKREAGEMEMEMETETAENNDACSRDYMDVHARAETKPADAGGSGGEDAESSG